MQKIVALERCLLIGLLVACSSTEAPLPQEGTGGSTAGGTGGAGAAGGTGAMGGSGGAGTTAGRGGTAAGIAGTGTGGASSGGGPTAGASSGGAPTGGTSFGGSSTGGNSRGGAAGFATGGASGEAGTAGGAGASSGAGGQTSMPCPGGGWTPGDERITLMHDGIEREYEVHIPASYTGTTRVPLVMTIHGAHNTIDMVKGWSQMNPVADANGFIVVYPQAVDCWNSGFMLCDAADDDVGFLTAVVADVQSHACIDPKRVYATGISNGAMMAQYLGCQEADVFAAVGGIAGPNGGGCNPSRPLSVVYMHGTEDSTVGYSGARSTVTGWAMRNGCSTTPAETYNMGSTLCETYSGCEENGEVVFCTHTGMGHCWPEDARCGPGGGPDFAITDFKASPFMWEFFKRHPLP
jgi:polyhydroxybutyrate depolymerase